MTENFSSAGQNNSSLYEISMQIAGDRVMNSLIFVNTWIYLAATASCAVLFWLLCKTSAFHFNLRLLLANLTCTIIVILAFSLFDIVLRAYGILFTNQGVIQDQILCQMLKFPKEAALFALTFSLPVIMVERLVATLKIKVYEKAKNMTTGFGLLAILWMGSLTSTGFNVNRAMEEGYWKRGPVISCSNGKSDPEPYIFLFVFFVIVDGACIAGFLSLLKWNKQKKSERMLEQARHNLSERYQIDENIRTTRQMYPVVLLFTASALVSHGIMFHALTIISGQSTSTHSRNDKVYRVLKHGELISGVVGLYGAIFPWICIRGHSNLKKQFLRRFSCFFDRNSVHPTGPTDINGNPLFLANNDQKQVYFTALANAWNLEKLRRNIAPVPSS